MTNYIGVACPVCSKRFASADDIVVCPVCGAPHHRECYRQSGECAFSGEHISGREWHNPEAEPEQEASAAQEDTSDGRLCPLCSAANPEQSIFCQVCGAYMSAPQTGGPVMQDIFQYGQTDPYGGVDKDETIEDLPVQEIARYVGPNSAYYIPRFYQISKEGAPVRGNLSAFFLSFFYYFYRKMYLVGAVMLALFAASTIPFFFLFWEMLPETLRVYGITSSAVVNMAQADFYGNLLALTIAVYLVISLGVSTFATRIYLKHTLENVREMRNEGGKITMGAYNPQMGLRAAGGVDKLSVIVVVGIIMVGINIVASLLINRFLA